MKKIVFIMCSLYFGNMMLAQTNEEKNKIIESYDLNELRKGKAELNKRNDEKQERLNTFFKNKKSINKRIEKGGVLYEIIDILPDGTPLYFRTFNHGSAKTIKANSLNTGGGLGLDINGENMTAGVWDGGLVRDTHIEFPNGKVKNKDAAALSNHSTHVTGTITGIGAWPGTPSYYKGISKGMASASSVTAYDWNDDINEMYDFGIAGGLVSNHSYGYAAINSKGEVLPVWVFGAYDGYSYNLDWLTYFMPQYQIVTSAGNDREEYTLINPSKNGYDLLTGLSTSKNVLTVAAVKEVTNYTGAASVIMSSFSSWGPTDDGRIKPNISAKGVSVFSAVAATADDYYGIMSGTSMASPAITGSILLLQQHFKNLNGKYMQSSSVRGLLQHTALEAGAADGPDYSFGWGLADVEASAVTISNAVIEKSIIEENLLLNGETYTKEIDIQGGTEPVIVSISWTDLPVYDINKGVVDPDIRYLVNDLDVRVKDPLGNIIQPWKLDGKNPSAPATKGDNVVDNFERIDIKNPMTGKYTITVTHKGTLKWYNGNTGKNVDGDQEYTLIVTGPDMKKMSIDEVETNVFTTKIYPIPAKNTLTVSVKEKSKYSIYEMTGKLVSSGNLKEGENVLNVSNMNKGTYIIKLENGSKNETKKIIIK